MNRIARVPRKAQRGVILFVALIVLVAMSLTGIALIRSVDTNVLVAGNLAFRQGATAAADWGVESARTYLKTTITANKAALDGDNPAAAYFATWQSGLDLVGTTTSPFNWSGGSQLVGTDSAGNEVRYVLHRMCEASGASTAAGSNCVKSAGSGGATGTDGSTKGTVSYSTLALPASTVVYYRVTVRVLGPRNTLSFVQAMLK
jgi:type IV pilus assembly protein PilX